MKKALAIALAAIMAVSLAACGGTTTSSSGTSSQDNSTSQSTSTGGGAEIAMITDKGDIDDKSFNQGTWEGIQAYCEENGKTSQYYKPAAATTDDYITSIEQAIKDGAKVIVTPGFLFEVPIYTVQEQHPDVKFILIDGNPNDGAKEPTYKTAENTVGIKFSEEQAGYLAGYAAVMDGHTKLGFLGGQAVPAVVNFGYGYVQGANDAAKELGITVEMMYTNTDGFSATPEAQAMAAGWYNAGTEIVFGCGGSVGNSVFSAAEASNGLSIGVDIDQSGESTTVVTSAMKGLAAAVEDVLDQYYTGSFPGGQNLILGADKNAVSLEMTHAKFTKFDTAAYDAMYQKLASGEVKVKNYEAASSADQLGTENCKVTVVTM